MEPINFWAVLVATILAYGVGALWYAVLFPKLWMQYLNRTPETMQGERSAIPMVAEFILTLISTYVLAHFVVAMNANSIVLATELALWVWLGFEATIMASLVLFEKRPLGLFFINASHRLVALLIAAIVLGLWH